MATVQAPSSAFDYLQRQGVDRASLLCCAEYDRMVTGGFTQGYLFLSRNTLYLLVDQNEVTEKTYKGYFTRKQKKTAEREPHYHLETMQVADVGKLVIVNLVASGLLVAQDCAEHGGEKALCAFTNGRMQQMTRFVSLYEKLREKGTLGEEDLADEDESPTCPKCGMVYPESGRRICPRCIRKSSVFLRLLKLCTRYKKSLIFILIFMLMNSLLGIVIPYLQGHVLYDWALKDRNSFTYRLLLVLALTLGCQLLSMLSGAGLGVVNARLAANVMKNLKIAVFSAMQRLSLSFFQKRQTGQLMARINNDSDELQHFFIDGIPYLIVNSLNAVGIIAIMLSIDWKLTLLCMIPVPILVIYVFRIFPKLYRLNWRRYSRRSKMTSLISDSFKGSRVVKAFGKEGAEIERFDRINQSFFDAEKAQGQMVQTVFPLMSMIMQAGGYIIWLFGGWSVMFGGLTFGRFMTFLSYIFMIYGPIQYLCDISDWWSYCMAAAQRIFEITDTIPEIKEKENAVHLDPFRGEICAENVTFCYEPNKPVLSNVSIHAAPGRMIGIVGHSGAGKSTLVNLITRLYDVTDGRILIDGVDLRDMKIADLRRNIGIVSQEVYVFMGSIAENIAYGDPDCSMEDVIRAAKLANAHDFIEKLPAGYDTIVGTGGQDLSGGEKQRISIARAVLHNPKILILDEATASLDTQTERAIQEGLETLIRGRTTIAIAHRLSTLRNADYLYVLENGKVSEEGTHAQLLANHSIYYRLFKKQNEALSLRALED